MTTRTSEAPTQDGTGNCSDSPVERSLRALLRLVAAGAISLAVACTPVPAPRPRITKWGSAYYPKSYVEFTATLQQEFAKQRAGDPLAGDLAVLVEVVSPRPKTTKLSAPRGDADNHAKGPLDALTKTKLFWGDDNQITDLIVNKRWSVAGETPGVRVRIASMED